MSWALAAASGRSIAELLPRREANCGPSHNGRCNAGASIATGRGRARPAAELLAQAQAAKPLRGLDCSELARLLVPLARRCRVRLQSDDVEPRQLVGIVGGGDGHRRLGEADVGGELEELSRRIDAAVVELFHALGIEAQRALTVGGAQLGKRRR